MLLTTHQKYNEKKQQKEPNLYMNTNAVKLSPDFTEKDPEIPPIYVDILSHKNTVSPSMYLEDASRLECVCVEIHFLLCENIISSVRLSGE